LTSPRLSENRFVRTIDYLDDWHGLDLDQGYDDRMDSISQAAAAPCIGLWMAHGLRRVNPWRQAGANRVATLITSLASALGLFGLLFAADGAN
jgi:hypothetical protein